MLNEDIIDAMLGQAMDIMRNAYTKDGGLPVGACALAEDGTMYAGCNLDNSVPQLNASAIQVAMYRALADGKRSFDGLAVVADTEEPYVPTGIDCELMAEFGVPEIIMGNMSGGVASTTLEELLPYHEKLRSNSRFHIEEQ